MRSVVFTKDRAMQLDAFLRSYQDHVEPVGDIHALYIASTPNHVDAYAEVFARHTFAIPWVQTDLKEDLLQVVEERGNVIFFVDDQIFIRYWKVQELPGLSLRLAPHLSRCYTLDLPQPLPVLERKRIGGANLFSWTWGDGQLDWGYPLSVDGHVFDAVELRDMLKTIAFNTPNTLENALQVYLPRFSLRKGFCYDETRVVNVPWNRVQTDWPNRSGFDADAEKMLAWWNQGLRIDVVALYDVVNESCHQELPLTLVPR